MGQKFNLRRFLSFSSIFILLLGAIYGVASGVWAIKAPMPIARHSAHTGVINGLLYVAGGNLGGAGVTSLLQIYNPLTDSWSTGPAMPESS